MPFELIVFEIDDGRSTNAAAAYRIGYRSTAAAASAALTAKLLIFGSTLCMVFCWFLNRGTRDFIPNDQNRRQH